MLGAAVSGAPPSSARPLAVRQAAVWRTAGPGPVTGVARVAAPTSFLGRVPVAAARPGPATPAAGQFHERLATPKRPTFSPPRAAQALPVPEPRARLCTSAGTKQPWQRLRWQARKKRPKRQNEPATDRMARVVQRAVEEKSQPPLEVKREVRGKFHPSAPAPARYVAHARQLWPIQLPA